MSYDPGIAGISGASDVFLNNPVLNDALSFNNSTGKWENVPLTKSRVGLGNIDNTSDANKPVSTATQALLDGKAGLAHTHAQTDITGFATALSAKADASSLSAVATTGSYNDLTDAPTGGGTLSTWQGTQAQYDALSTYDGSTIYTVTT